MTRTPSARSTASNGPQNLASRSRRRNRTPARRSSMARFLACPVTHPESGCAVTPATCTRDVGETVDAWALAMPRAETSLRAHLQASGGQLAPDETVAVLVDVATALAALDGRVVHRD